MNSEARERALDKIRENIARHGYHVYVVSGGQQPRFAYTIGLGPKIGEELVFAGGILYMYKDVGQIIDTIVDQLTSKKTSVSEIIRIDPHGTFSLRACESSWSNALLLGASDFYKKTEVSALQIVPDKEHWTIDVPDMTQAWDPTACPVWRWLKDEWPYPVPATSHAVTDLDALRGMPITEACRWEEDYWELFSGAGPDVSEEESRVAPLSMLLAVDPTLSPVLDLAIGDGIWREEGSEWHVWKTPDTTEGEPA